MDTIVALATARGTGGIAIIRISGDNAFRALESVFSAKGEHRQLVVGKLSVGEIVDTACAIRFVAPNSFTGEDVAELHVHGSPVLVELVVQSIIKSGLARLARAGEYSRRAFLNGKLGLSQAEAIADVINSDSVQALTLATSTAEGKLNRQLVSLQDSLQEVLTTANVCLDYPEEQEEESAISAISPILDQVTSQLAELRQSFDSGRLIKEGVRIAVVGAPNSGKSSLCNALLGFDRSIVSDIAGTTRDVVEDSYVYEGVRFILADTAGVRSSTDKIEQIGIDRTHQTAREADIILLLDDSLPTDSRTIKIKNKIDKKEIKPKNDEFGVSALLGTNIAELKKIIFNKSIKIPQRQTAILTSLRHFQSVAAALDALKCAKSALTSTRLDVLASEVYLAWLALGEITGTTANEKIIENIFQKFCVGK